MTEPADVSVIMPAYRNADTIEQALLSVAAQRLRPREVLVVDDCSDDDTIARVQALSPRMNGIGLRLFKMERNSGAGAARNVAVAHAVGRWLAFLDADDRWLDDKLAVSVERTEGQGRLMSSHNLFDVRNGAVSEHPDCVGNWRRHQDDPYLALFLKGFISCPTVVVDRARLVAAGGFDQGLRSAQDYEMWLAVLRDLSPEQFAVLEDRLLLYTDNPTGITSRIGRKIWCSLRILARHRRTLWRDGLSAWRWNGLRIAYIGGEAFLGFVKRRRYGWAALAAAMTALLMTASPLLAVIPGYSRPDFLRALPPHREVAP